MDKQTRELLAPFMASFKKRRKPYMTRVSEVQGAIVKLENGLRVAAPVGGQKVAPGDLVTVLDGAIR